MDALPNTTMARQERARLREIAALFLKLGATAFGGPAAHIAMMEEEVVRRRQWLTSGEFLDLVGATNLIPGPNSTELAIHIGHRRAGWAGLLVAGVCFILPAMLMVTLLAWVYVRFGRLPQVEGLLYGVKPVIIAIVGRALWPLACSAVRSRSLAVIGLTAAVLNLAGVNELLILFGAGAIVAAPRWLKQPGSNDPSTLNAAAPALGLATATSAAGASTMTFGLGPLFLFFLKVGAVLFGSGYVLLAFLRADLVERWHWLGEAQLLDAIAVGQITPGPVFTTATFIGYLLGMRAAFLPTGLRAKIACGLPPQRVNESLKVIAPPPTHRRCHRPHRSRGSPCFGGRVHAAEGRTKGEKSVGWLSQRPDRLGRRHLPAAQRELPIAAPRARRRLHGARGALRRGAAALDHRHDAE